MSEGERDAFLGEPNLAVLATVDRRGRAHAAPVWYLYEGGEFIISTGDGSQKHRNIEANPDISIVVDRRVSPIYYVSAFGRAAIGPAMTEDMRRQLATRYLSAEAVAGYMANIAPWPSVTIRLRPRKFIEFTPPI
jgi:PPOX class probable F420-dependent enzyme